MHISVRKRSARYTVSTVIRNRRVGDGITRRRNRNPKVVGFQFDGVAVGVIFRLLQGRARRNQWDKCTRFPRMGGPEPWQASRSS